ncbi:phenylacetate--CoA ligase family protein [Iodobacter fluviatilis]|uniref:AMP-dependent synthetase/ligase domain-containing protein n=1 Tax=Iodobacter fluviatilis TaxID=537 RepID=A0A7G3GAM6_9NEIS|nr:phenylacetate--CoA ligase family protein [Iodobacter fluviatilis]QBC44321.1 hypothetical protein C1H71_12810 [Iodobacter fluviatilis]
MNIIKHVFEFMLIESIYLLGFFNNKLKIYLINKIKIRKMRAICAHAFHNSLFYRESFFAHGILEKDLRSLTFEQLPVVKKSDIVENIQDVFTDKTLNKDDVFDYIYNGSTEKAYQNKYICFTTSGTLGLKMPVLLAINDFKTFVFNTFLYNSKPFKILLGKKTKVAMLGAVEGRSAGIAFIKNLPKSIFETKEISLLLPIDKIINELNEFSPEQLVSYPGVFCSLIPYKESGALTISPKKIVLSGEILTEENAERINKAFNCEISNSYGASECLIMGVKKNKNPYRLYHNICNVEILDKDNKPAKEGELGRIVITNFVNYSQPIIRYDIGDFAVSTMNKHGEMTFDGVSGRNNKPIFFKGNKGEQVELFYIALYSLFLFSSGIYKSQMLIGENSIKALIVGTNECIAKCEINMEKLLRSNGVDQTVNFFIEKVEDILPDSNGKIPFIKFQSS